LDVMNTLTVSLAGMHQFTGVVAMRPADHDHNVRFARQSNRGGLPLARRLANSVGEGDLRIGKTILDKLDKPPHAIDWLSGLGGDAEAWPWLKREHILLGQDDVELREIFGQAADFDMIAAADDDRMESAADEVGDGTMRQVHQRARRFDHVQAVLADARHHAVRRAVGANHDRAGINGGRIVDDVNAALAQLGQDGFIMNQIAKNGERPGLRTSERKVDGVADAETHAEMLRADDFHTMRETREHILCKAKYMTMRVRFGSNIFVT
jgi:hypothetical protein